ncbi:MAG: hypothetical protein HOO17_10820 [Bacteroidetes Order II. Incertae sedis bacterium]|nr:hypothetical protein [Bacteroidetes Order II. bacterium]
MEFTHNGPDVLRLGIVFFEGVRAVEPSSLLNNALKERLLELGAGLTLDEDVFRTQVRDVFRNGSYKPTGRAKPASEYLLRAASESNFPRINTLVDCCNYLSIASLLPISIWDAERANTDTFVFRLGFEDEEYTFNSAGHVIRLKDLIVGCRVLPDNKTAAIVNAVKDSMATKTNEHSSIVAAAVYAPMHEGPTMTLEKVCTSFVEIVSTTSTSCTGKWRILTAGETVHL